MKKNLKILLAIIIGIIITSCSKDKENVNEEINSKTFTNTFWEGKIDIKNAGVSTKYETKITFTSDKGGTYTYQADKDRRLEGTFTYVVNGNSLAFDFGVNNILLGYWIVESYKDGVLTIIRNVQDPENKSVLVIKKSI